VGNEEVLHGFTEERNILHAIKRRKVNWIGQTVSRNCLLKYVIEEKLEGRIQVTGRRGRRRKYVLNDSKEKRGYWILKEEALDRPLWRIWCGKWLWTCRKTDYSLNDE